MLESFASWPAWLNYYISSLVFTCLERTRSVTKWYHHGSDSTPCKWMCSDTFSLQCISLMPSMQHSRSYLGQPALCFVQFASWSHGWKYLGHSPTTHSILVESTGRSCSGKRAIESKWDKVNAQHATNTTWVHNKMPTEYVDILTCYDM